MQISNQYEMLKRCSQKKDLSEWNEWRKNNPEEDIHLRGYYFEGFFLKDANFIKGNVYNKSTNMYINYTGEVNFEEANFKSANLENVSFGNAFLKKTNFNHAEATNVDFYGTNLEESDLSVANLQKSSFSGAFLKNSRIISSHLEGAKFSNANMVGCWVRGSICDNATIFFGIKVNRFSEKKQFTDFSATSLGNIRIDSGTQQLLEYNIRRLNWLNWYKKHSLLQWLVRPFWWMSDYGLSTWRIILSFFLLAIFFTIIYFLHPKCVIVNGVVGDIKGIVHALYFSVVTMTTLGFGDIAANPESWFGQIALMVQVILGYVHLGALVTRFAVLFTSGGPSADFFEEESDNLRS